MVRDNIFLPSYGRTVLLLALLAQVTVSLSTDPITDERSAILSLRDGAKGLAIRCKSKASDTMVLLPGDYVGSKADTAVFLRFDDRPAEKQTWYMTGKAVVTDANIATALVNIRKSTKLTARVVGYDRRQIDVVFDYADAEPKVAEFESACAKLR